MFDAIRIIFVEHSFGVDFVQRAKNRFELLDRSTLVRK